MRTVIAVILVLFGLFVGGCGLVFTFIGFSPAALFVVFGLLSFWAAHAIMKDGAAPKEETETADKED